MQYNRSLDFMISAAVKLPQGKHELAAKLMLKASREPSFAKAIQIMEASNERAFQIQASAAAERQKVMAAEEAEDAELESLVTDFDEGDEADEVDAEFEPEGEPEEVEDEAIEEQVQEEPAYAKFARVLGSLEKPKSKAKTTAKKAQAKK